MAPIQANPRSRKPKHPGRNPKLGYAKGYDLKKNRLEKNPLREEETLQGSRQADPTELLARWSSQHGVRRMLSNQRSAPAKQAAVQTARLPDLAGPVVVRVSQQRLRALLPRTSAQEATLQETRTTHPAECLEAWKPLNRLQSLSQRSPRLSACQGPIQRPREPKYEPSQKEEAITRADFSCQAGKPGRSQGQHPEPSGAC